MCAGIGCIACGLGPGCGHRDPPPAEAAESAHVGLVARLHNIPTGKALRELRALQCRLGKDWALIPAEKRASTLRIISGMFLYEGKLGPACELRMEALEVTGTHADSRSDNADLAFTAYLAALTGKKAILERLERMRTGDPWRDYFAILRRWSQARDTDLERAVRALEAKGGARVPAPLVAWTRFVLARSRAQMGEPEVALRILTEEVAPFLKALRPGVWHVLLVWAEIAEKAGAREDVLFIARKLQAHLSPELGSYARIGRDRVQAIIDRVAKHEAAVPETSSAPTTRDSSQPADQRAR